MERNNYILIQFLIDFHKLFMFAEVTDYAFNWNLHNLSNSDNVFNKSLNINMIYGICIHNQINELLTK